MVVRKLDDAPDRVRGARLPLRLGLEGLPADRRGVRDRRARPACASRTSCPSRSSRPPPRPSRATTRTSTSSARPSWSADRALTEAVRDVSIAVYRHAADHARERGIILADTKFEFGLDSEGAAHARRRGVHARTPRASGRPTRTSRAAPAELRQAVRARLGLRRPAGTALRRRRPIPDEVVARTREKYIEAYERITGEPFDAWLQRTR